MRASSVRAPKYTKRGYKKNSKGQERRQYI